MQVAHTAGVVGYKAGCLQGRALAAGQVVVVAVAAAEEQDKVAGKQMKKGSSTTASMEEGPGRAASA